MLKQGTSCEQWLRKFPVLKLIKAVRGGGGHQHDACLLSDGVECFREIVPRP